MMQDMDIGIIYHGVQGGKAFNAHELKYSNYCGQALSTCYLEIKPQ